MRAVSMQCWLAKFLLTLVLIGVAGNGAAAQTDDLASLNRRVGELYAAGKFGEAVPLAERSLELTRALRGEDHLDTAARIAPQFRYRQPARGRGPRPDHQRYAPR